MTSSGDAIARLRRHTLGDLIQRSAARHPEKPAIIFIPGIASANLASLLAD